MKVALVIWEQVTLTQRFLNTKLGMTMEDSQRIAKKIISLDVPILFGKMRQALR